MKVVGLDIATESGAAIIDGDEIRAITFRAKSDTEDRRKARDKLNANGKSKSRPEACELHEKAESFRRWLKALLAAEEPAFVAIEAPPLNIQDDITFEPENADLGGGRRMVRRKMTNPETLRLLQSLNLVAGMVCVEMSIPFSFAAPSSHRKAFLGTGRPPKGEAKKLTLAKCRQLGLDIKSTDAADAVSIAWWGAGQANMKHAMGRFDF